RDGVVGAHRDRLGVLEPALVPADVLRYVDQDRAGAAGPGDVEGLAHGRREVLHVLDQEVVLDARAGDAHGVAFLEGVLADRVGRDLAAQDDHRHRVHVGGGDAGHGIGDAGPGGDQADAYAVGGARIGI